MMCRCPIERRADRLSPEVWYLLPRLQIMLLPRPRRMRLCRLVAILAIDRRVKRVSAGNGDVNKMTCG